jgi:dihydrofolate reductase
MNGGTTFHFLSASPAQALAQARQAAAGRDIRTGGGPSTIREFLAAGLIDYLHIVVVPIVLGRGGDVNEYLAFRLCTADFRACTGIRCPARARLA